MYIGDEGAGSLYKGGAVEEGQAECRASGRPTKRTRKVQGQERGGVLKRIGRLKVKRKDLPAEGQ